MEINSNKLLKLILANVIIIGIAAVIVVFAVVNPATEKNRYIRAKAQAELVSETVLPESREVVSYFKKTASVKNTGEVPCFVRIRLKFSDSGIEDAIYISGTVREDAYDKDGTRYYKYKKAAGDKDDTEYFADHLPGGWMYIDVTDTEYPEDMRGYYYYIPPVSPGKETLSPLVTYFRIDYGDEDKVRSFDVDIEVDCIKATDSKGNLYEKAIEAGQDSLWSKGGR